MENSNLLVGLQWVVGTILTLLSALGVSKMLEKRADRKYALADKNAALHDSNLGKQLDADSAFMLNLMKRIDTLEVEQKEMQAKLLTQAVTSARTEEENKHLKETNVRQEEEIKGLREDRKKDGVKIINLENTLKRTQEDLRETQKLLKELSEKYDIITKAR